MLPFRRVLFPVDYSHNCEATVPYVIDWADRFGASIKLVHACGAILNIPYDLMVEAAVTWPEDVMDYEKDRLAEFAAKHFPGREVEMVVERGEAAAGIQEVISRDGTDLIMMPTHGYGPVRKMLLGSTTAKLLHDVTTPLWTASYKVLDREIPSIPVQSIVCAVDESEEHEAVAVAGDRIAHRLGAKLSLVRASFPVPGFPEVDATNYQRELVAVSAMELGRVKEAHCGDSATLTVAIAPVLYAVCDEVRRTKADLLIVGRGKSHDAFARAFSSLYPMIRDAGCPVLSI
ncbi:universal stress protein [Bryobacterales bacterium F-183]|nr:universal stress protein [Bryobacterales bacterium F-183]